MMTCWAAWKPVPNGQIGGHIEAPIGPGVYEIRHVQTGEAFAFGASDNVAHELARILPKPNGSQWVPFGRKRGLRGDELEYRTCAATTAAEAKIMAERLRGRRRVFWRRRVASGWA